MTLPIFPKQAVDMMRDVNGRPYDAKTNPKGLGNGGHRQVFPDSLQAMVEGLTYTQQVALALEVLARLVETSTADAKVAAETAAAQAIRAEGAATDAGTMSDAGRDFVRLRSYAAMFDAIRQPATNGSRGVVYVCNEREVMDPTNDRDVITPAMLEYWRTQNGLGAVDFSRTGWIEAPTDLMMFPDRLPQELRNFSSYATVTISAVKDYKKCLVTFEGYGELSDGSETGRVFSCMINNTTLAIGHRASNRGFGMNTMQKIAGKWTVGTPS